MNGTSFESTETPNSVTESSQQQIYSQFWHCVFTFVHTLLIIVTIFANFAVIFAFSKHWNLLIVRPRLKTNAFILNLAVFDFLVGAITWPLSVIYKLSGRRWYFGPLLCHLWIDSDYLLTCGSIFNIALLSLDRYLGMKLTSQYTVPHKTRNHVIFLMIFLTWFVPLTIYVPVNEVWALHSGTSMLLEEGGQCMEPWNDHNSVVWAVNMSISIPTLLCLIIPYSLLIGEVLRLRNAKRNVEDNANSLRDQNCRNFYRQNFFLNLGSSSNNLPKIKIEPKDNIDCSSGEYDKRFKSRRNSEIQNSEIKFDRPPRLLKQPSRDDWSRLLTDESYRVVHKEFDFLRGQLQVDIHLSQRGPFESRATKPLKNCRNAHTVGNLVLLDTVPEITNDRAESKSADCLEKDDGITLGTLRRASHSSLNDQSLGVISRIGSQLFSKTRLNNNDHNNNNNNNINKSISTEVNDLSKKLSALERIATKTASSIKQLDFIFSQKTRSRANTSGVENTKSFFLPRSSSFSDLGGGGESSLTFSCEGSPHSVGDFNFNQEGGDIHTCPNSFFGRRTTPHSKSMSDIFNANQQPFLHKQEVNVLNFRGKQTGCTNEYKRPSPAMNNNVNALRFSRLEATHLNKVAATTTAAATEVSTVIEMDSLMSELSNQVVVNLSQCQKQDKQNHSKGMNSAYEYEMNATRGQRAKKSRKSNQRDPAERRRKYTLVEIIQNLDRRIATPPALHSHLFSDTRNVDTIREEYRNKLRSRERNSLSECDKTNNRRNRINSGATNTSVPTKKTSWRRRASSISNAKIRIWVTTPENAKFIGHVIVLVATCLLCWVPYCFVSTAYWSNKLHFHPITFDLVVWLVYFNSFMNPFLYLSQNKIVRRAVVNTLYFTVPVSIRRRMFCLIMCVRQSLGRGVPQYDETDTQFSL